MEATVTRSRTRLALSSCQLPARDSESNLFAVEVYALDVSMSRTGPALPSTPSKPHEDQGKVIEREWREHLLNPGVQSPVHPNRSPAMQHADVHNRRTVPIAQLPPELLCYVFKIAFDALEQPGAKHAFRVRMSQVSQHWRDIALSMASLWSLVILPVSEYHLLRSKTHPLDIILDIYLFSESEDQSMAAECDTLESSLEVLIPYCHRWRRFCVQTTHEDTIPNLLVPQINTLDVPLLELLSLSNRSYDGTFVDCDEVYFENNAPRLRDLRLGGFFISDYPSPSTITALHMGLSEVNTGGFDFESFSGWVGQFWALVHLTLDGWAHYGDWPPTADSEVRLEHLRSLTFCGCDCEDSVSKVLKVLQAPLLEELAFIGESDVRFQSESIIEAIAQQALHSPTRYDKLRTLAFQGIPIGRYVTPAFMHALPSLSMLSFTCADPERASELWRQLAVLPDSPPLLWPHLRYISVGLGLSDVPRVVGAEEQHALLDFLRSRSSAGRPVALLRLEEVFLEMLSDDTILKLRAQVRLESYKRMELPDPFAFWEMPGRGLVHGCLPMC
ncbi:hypothetical protein PLICRDRAFT_42776 [Plicaturopsis crispa FD-325 SS-3]|nr:hypothetical protein PLICRDRAFT_42776 [Plicaturopsis crispa FD-325 SS-3]